MRTAPPIDRSRVDRDDLRRAVAEMRGPGADPVLGLYGPDSLMWRVNRHTLVYLLGITQAAFLDVAHPAIAHGIAEHSTIFRDPRARARGTYAALTSIVFDDLDAVVRTSRSLFHMHDRVHGTAGADAGPYAGAEYQAHQVDLLVWVHATMWWARRNLYEAIVEPLTPVERERFLEETVDFARCFGIPPERLPGDVEEWDRYVRSGADGVLAASDHSRRVMSFLTRQIPRPLRAHLLAFNAMMLPEPARSILGLPSADDPRTGRRHRRVLRLLRFLDRVLPGPLSELPPYRFAMARVTGRTPDAPTRAFAGLLAGRGTNRSHEQVRAA